jgi:hypothetical protein
MNEELYGLLGIDPEKLRQQQLQSGLLSAGLQLLAGSGYSPVRRTTGELLGQAGAAGLGAYQQAAEGAIDQALKGMQIREMQTRQKEAERLRQARQTFEDRIAAATGTQKVVPSTDAEAQEGGFYGQQGVNVLPTRQVTDQGAADRAVMEYLRVSNPAEYAKLLVKEPKAAPTSIQEYEYALSQGFKGSFEQFKEKMARAGASTVNLPSGEERKAGFLTNRIAFNLSQISDITRKNPPAASPEALPTVIKYLTNSDFLSTKLTSSDRKRIENAQLDILDAALTMGTGAAYTKEQLESYRQSYFPQLGEDAATVADKQKRLKNLLESAYITSGRAAPPEVSRAQIPEPPSPTVPAPKLSQSDADLLKKYMNFRNK